MSLESRLSAFAVAVADRIKTVQSGLSGKQATLTGAATSIATLNLAASRALASDASGKVAVSSATAAELAFLTGVTSAIQTQLNSRPTEVVGTFTPYVYGSTVAGSASYTTQQGTYQKVGKGYDFDIALSWSGHTGSGAMYVGGMPFVAANFSAPNVVSNGLTVAAGNIAQSIMWPGGTAITIYKKSTTGTLDFLLVESYSAGELYISGHVRTAS